MADHSTENNDPNGEEKNYGDKDPDNTDSGSGGGGPDDPHDGDDRKKEKYMPFTEHLEELRKRLFYCIGSIVVFGAASYYFSSELLEILTRPNPGVQLQILKPTGGFIVHLKVSFFAGLLISIPVLIYHFWNFISPGLFDKEKNYLFPVIFFTVFSFTVGALFAYFIVLPFGLQFLLGFETESIIAQWTIDDFISFVTMMMIVFGIVFELPLVAMFLGKIGIINHVKMAEYRRYALVGAVIFGAVLTPPDFITQIALAIPLWILYEISIILVRISGKNNENDDN